MIGFMSKNMNDKFSMVVTTQVGDPPDLVEIYKQSAKEQFFVQVCKNLLFDKKYVIEFKEMEDKHSYNYYLDNPLTGMMRTIFRVEISEVQTHNYRMVEMEDYSTYPTSKLYIPAWEELKNRYKYKISSLIWNFKWYNFKQKVKNTLKKINKFYEKG